MGVFIAQEWYATEIRRFQMIDTQDETVVNVDSLW